MNLYPQSQSHFVAVHHIMYCHNIKHILNESKQKGQIIVVMSGPSTNQYTSIIIHQCINILVENITHTPSPVLFLIIGTNIYLQSFIFLYFSHRKTIPAKTYHELPPNVINMWEMCGMDFY